MIDVRVEIYTWMGSSIGAIHYYVDLHYSPKEYKDWKTVHRLQRPLSKRAASSINKRMRFMYDDKTYKLYRVSPGEMDGRYDTKEEALQAAKDQWRTLFPDADRLVDYKDNKVYDVRI